MELKQLVSINRTAAMEMIHGRARCSAGCTKCIIQAPAALPEDGAARRACELSALWRPALLTAGWGAVFPLPAPAGAFLGAPFGSKATNFTAENRSPGFVLAPTFTQLVNALAGCLRRRVLCPAGLEACLPRDLQLAPARTRRRASEVSGLEGACGD